MASTRNAISTYSSRFQYSLPECYIYLYHTDEYFILPQYPETLDDSLTSTFAQQNALSRTAPVYAYSNSGPRSCTITLDLHRDMMNNVNVSGSNVRINTEDPNNLITSISEIRELSNTIHKDDYVDLLIKKLQEIALPVYKASNKEVDPPRVAIRLGNEFFIKGVVQGGLHVTYKMPLLENKKYARANISFSVYETTPFDAATVGLKGSFRGVTSGLLNKLGGK